MKRNKKWIVLAVIAMVLVALPLLRNQEDKRVKDHRPADKTYVDTARGSLHYELRGPEDAPLVVMIHGVSGPMMVWDRTVPALLEAGHRTLRFDHFGRGLSDRVDGPYDLALYVGSLEELLAKVAKDARVDLLGSSMGAIVAAAFAERHSDRVRSVTLIGPAGFPLEATPIARLMRVPYLSDYLMKVVGDNSLAAHNRKYFHDPTPHADFQRAFEDQLRFVGSKHAILSTLQNTPVQSYVDGYRALAGRGVPITVIWGKQDAAFPHEHSATLAEAIPKAQLHTIDNAGHLPMYERHEQVTPILESCLAAARQ